MSQNLILGVMSFIRSNKIKTKKNSQLCKQLAIKVNIKIQIIFFLPKQLSPLQQHLQYLSRIYPSIPSVFLIHRMNR